MVEHVSGMTVAARTAGAATSPAMGGVPLGEAVDIAS